MQEPTIPPLQPVQPSSSAATGQEGKITGVTDQDSASTYPPVSAASRHSFTGAFYYTPEKDYVEFPDQQFSDTDFSGDDSNAEEF